jgi:3-dehydroquinate synthase
VVRKDPYETRGPRRYLNLGHTLGHALEAYHGMPHGIAVGIGIYFSIWVSWCEGLLRSEAFFEIERKLALNWGISLEGLASLKIPRDEVARLFLRDKKAIASGEVCFIALRGVGRPVPLVLRVDDLLEHLEGFWG